jgi:hypothetical protein
MDEDDVPAATEDLRNYKLEEEDTSMSSSEASIVADKYN